MAPPAFAIVRGCQQAIDKIAYSGIGIADEVANGKLAAASALELESASSGNTLADILNNILGISAAYDHASATVAAISPEIDVAVREQIRTALAAIVKVPAPLRDSLTLSAAEVQAAIAAVAQIQSTLEQIGAAIMPQTAR